MTSIPEISACGSLILWAKFQIPVGPRSGREGEKCRPLDHMRQIPFINQAPFAFYTKISFYIYTKLFRFSLPCGIYIVSWKTSICYLRMRSPEPLILRFRAIVKSSVFSMSYLLVEIQQDPALKTKHRYIAIWCWSSQRANFASMRKKRCLTHTGCSILPTIKRSSRTFCSNF